MRNREVIQTTVRQRFRAQGKLVVRKGGRSRAGRRQGSQVLPSWTGRTRAEVTKPQKGNDGSPAA